MKKPAKNWLEWVVFAVSLLLVIGTIGYLLYDNVTSDNDPPDIQVQFGAPVQGTTSFRLPVTVSNHGSETAEDATIEVTLTHGAAQETAQLHFDYLPRRSTRNGWVTFRTDPQHGTLEARVLGYQQP